MPVVATSPADLLARLAGSARLEGERLAIHDADAFRDAGIRDLAWTAAFSMDEATIEAAQWLVWEASQVLGARSASIQALYEARARGEVSGFTVPAINLRTQVFDRHGRDFAAKSSDDYAAQAWRFRERAVAGRLPMKLDTDGTVRVFDPKTRAFASFNRDGTTKTYFRPDNPSYWQRQPGRPIQTPPWVSQ